MRRSGLNASFILVAILALMPGTAAAAAPAVRFFDEDGTTLLGEFAHVHVDLPASTDAELSRGGFDEKMEIVQRDASEGGGWYLSWKALNKVPDYNGDQSKVILSWARKGETGRFDLSDITARPFDAGTDAVPDVKRPARGPSRTRADLEPLNDDEVVDLVPLKTMSMAEFKTIAYDTGTVDTHTDSPGRMVGPDWRPVPANDLVNETGRSNTAQGLYPWRVAGGSRGMLHAAFTSNNTAQDISRRAGDRANSRGLSLLNATHWSASRNPGLVTLVTTAKEFKDAFAADPHNEKVVIMQSIESAYALTEENHAELLEQYWDLGVRMLSFTWNPNSYLAAGNLMKFSDVDGVSGATSTGMTELGKKALRKMNQLGMVFDVSHSDDDTVNDALAITDPKGIPIVASHSGSRQEFDHERNLWPAEIIAIAKGGGVIFQNFYGDFIAEPRSVSEIVDQIDDMVEILVGAGFTRATALDHIGMGTDFDGGTNNADANDARYVYRFAKELLARGYTAEEIAKIRCENTYRLLDAVQGKADLAYRMGSAATIAAPKADGVALGWGDGYAQLKRADPKFTATVTGAASGRVIVDGIVVDSTLEGGVLTADLAGKPLQEAFHVVTFEATDSSGKVARDTTIFDIVDAPVFHKVQFMDQDDASPISTVYVASGDVLATAQIPVETPDGRSIAGWSMSWTGLSFDVTAPLARSYRLVAAAGAPSGGGSGGGCDGTAFGSAAAISALAALIAMRRKRP